jgi:transcriptional regulator with XRE-family HTH domain
MAGKLGNTAAKLTPIEQWRAEKIREIYQKGPYLQKDLAKALGIHQSQVSRYLRGRSAWKQKHLEILAEIYQLPLDGLLLGKEEALLFWASFLRRGFLMIQQVETWSGLWPKDFVYVPRGPPVAHQDNLGHCALLFLAIGFG